MPLEEYHDKRHFDTTPEPAGADPDGAAGRPPGRPEWAGDGLAYLIHEHHARALHFDLRLEWGGVLMSWAVPKGPSLDPKDKRLAVHVEDHPLEYGTFQGTIPAGEYGAGEVVLWDRGTWEPIQDPAVTLPKGELKFRLHGAKLTGAWMLVRMKPRPGEKRENWLLFKERDDAARPGFDTLGELPGSVAGGGTASPAGDAP
jgi:bifunctional non-homologous end joining protein LigD